MLTRYTLLLMIVLGLFSASLHGQVPDYVPADGLVAWWPFNGNANDESGNGYNGTVNGATLTTDRYGTVSSAYFFDGINDVINLPLNAGQIANSSAFSIQFWFIPSASATNFQTVFANWQTVTPPPNGTPVSFYTGYSANGAGYNIATAYRREQAVGTISQPSSLTYDHVVIIYNGSATLSSDRQIVYLNGAIQPNNFSCEFCEDNIPTSIGGLVDHTSIGARYATSQNTLIDPFSGKIDDIGIWNRVLTQEEIEQLYIGPSASIKDHDRLLSKIFPNPSNGRFQIEMKTAGSVQLSIINAVGEVVWSENLTGGQNSIRSIDCSALPSGSYVAMIQDQDHRYVHKLIIE